MVRKSELQDATWDEVDFENTVWTIPKERMKWSKPHNVYLSQQAVAPRAGSPEPLSKMNRLWPYDVDQGAPVSRRLGLMTIDRARRSRNGCLRPV
jgi:integrase